MRPTYDDSTDFKMLGDEFTTCLNLTVEPLICFLINGNKKQEPHILKRLATDAKNTMLFEEWPSIFLCENENELIEARKTKFVQLGTELQHDKKAFEKWNNEWKKLQPHIVSGDNYDYWLWKDNPLTVKFKTEYPNGGKPVQLRPIPQTQEITDKLKQKLTILAKRGYIKKATKMEWRMQLFGVWKPNKKDLRIICDLRPLNFVTKMCDSFLYEIKFILKQLIKLKFFFSIDITGAYWNIPVPPEFQKYFTFGTVIGDWTFLRAPHGYHRVVWHMNQGMTKLLQDIENVFSFYDDITGGADTYTECAILAIEVMHRLRKAGVRINPEKCHIAVKQITCLGYKISQGLITREAIYVQKIIDFVLPHTYRELQAFIGVCQWLSDAIPALAHHLSALTEVLKREKQKHKFSLTNEEQQAFVNCKEVCKNPLPLELPIPNTPFTVFTDASQYAWAGVVTQKREDNTLRIVGVVSKKFTGCELNWHVSHKECYAVIATLWKFQHILMGTPIHVLTDHRKRVFNL